MKRILLLLALTTASASAQDTVRYVGSEMVRPDYHHGQLRPVMGIHNIQTFRANRNTELVQGRMNWTYNHAPNLAYWNGKFYLQFLANPIGEHVPPGQTLLQTSVNGYSWSDPIISFPPYRLPNGLRKKDREEIAKDLDAVMHQRMGFFVSSTNKLLTLAYYGIVMGKGDDPNDGNGVGRVVREINADGSMGPIYFIRFNKSFDSTKASYPHFSKSKDKAFIKACEELLSKPLLMQEWVEEADRDDPLISLKKDIKAFSHYHLNDGRVVGLWKHALTSISNNEGKSWSYSPLRAPGFVNSNAKIWGQKTASGEFITVYNPSEFRWPLALSVSNDGLTYNRLLLVNGQITSMRYGGAYKSYGPQYVRGIEEGMGMLPDKATWVTYSMNKEDMWVARIPQQIRDKQLGPVDEVFNAMPHDQALANWNINSGIWTPVKMISISGKKAIELRDSDPFDYAYAERVLPEASKMKLSFSVRAAQLSHGLLDMELADGKGNVGLRLSLDSTGSLQTKAGYRNRKLASYQADSTLNIELEVDVLSRFYTVTVNGKKLSPGLLFAPLTAIERFILRTGPVRRFPDTDTPTDQNYDLPGADRQDKEAVYHIYHLKAEVLK